MSTFDGFVREIPFISVDRFDCYRIPMPKIYFLTHCHTDHIKGLDYSLFQKKLIEHNVYIYASPITVNVMKKEYPDIESQFEEIEVIQPTIITYKVDESEEQHLQVTAIPAGHCPGSVMFFFENEENILCTGDFRISSSELRKFKIFHTSSRQLKQIDTIYLDSTFFSEEYPHFPTRQESCDTLCTIVKTWLNQSPKNKVYLQLAAKYSVEFLFISLAHALNEKIHVHHSKTLYCSIPDLDDIVSSKDGEYRIHSRDNRKRFTCCTLYDTYTLVINLSAMKWKNFVPNTSPKRWIDDGAVDVCISFHPSYSETKEFLWYLKPKRVELCVQPEDDDKKESMHELLESVLEEIRKEQKRDTKSFKGKSYDTFEIKDHSPSKFSPAKRKRRCDDLLSSPPRNTKKPLHL